MVTAPFVRHDSAPASPCLAAGLIKLSITAALVYQSFQIHGRTAALEDRERGFALRSELLSRREREHEQRTRALESRLKRVNDALQADADRTLREAVRSSAEARTRPRPGFVAEASEPGL